MRCLKLLLLAPLLLLPAFAGVKPDPLIDVEIWRIKPGGNKPHDFWLDGIVKNVSSHRLTGVSLKFRIETRSGFVLGEAEAPVKLSTMLPGQQCPFAAPVPLHDRRMYRLRLSGVTTNMVDDLVLFKEIPFHTSRKERLIPKRSPR